ncbi:MULTISPECIES: substrate-binding domain-containing protein [unclassified Microbacterium]|uniref:substrate-binding domain-containing protein n=1 Tax=unclassified Microbacterium TaxID=2609290 RepID=UPI003016F96E
MNKTRVVTGASIAAVAGLLLLTSCASNSAGSPSADPGDGDTLEIAMVLNSQTRPFYQTMIAGAEEAAEELGVNLTWQGPAEESAANQTSMLQQVAAGKPDGIIFSASDSVALSAPLKAIFDGGTPVVTVDSDVADPAARLFTIKSDGQESGTLAAERANEVTGGEGKVGYLGYTPGIESIDLRLSGWEEALKQYPGLENVGNEYAGLDISENQLKATGLISRVPDIDAIYTSWGNACIGAAQAVKQAGKSGDIALICVDADKEQVDLLAAGDVDALTIQQAAEMGRQSVTRLVEYIRNGTESDDVLLAHVLATQENMNEPEIEALFYR